MAITRENIKDIRNISCEHTGRGESELSNAVLGIRKLNHDYSEPGMDAYKHQTRLINANRYGTSITIVHTPGMKDMTDESKTSKKIKTELQLYRQHVAVFYTVFKAMTEIDQMCVEQIRRNMDCITRRKMFFVLTDFLDIKGEENSRCTKSKVPVIRINNKLKDNKKTQLQIKTKIRKIQIRENLVERYSAAVVVPVLQSTIIVLILIMVLLQEGKANNTTKHQVIQWKLRTKPVYFGGNVDLECTIKTTDISAPMAWVRMPKGEAIAYNNVSSNREKYGVTVKYSESTMIYNLTIKQFDSTDINRVYRCDFGFQSYAEELVLNDNNFIAKPTEKDVEYNFSLVANFLAGRVMIFNGYPKPLCRIKFEEVYFFNSLIISNTNNSIFYNTRIKFKYHTDMCNGNVSVACSYGDTKVTIDHYVDTCSDLSIHRGKVFKAIITATVVGSLLIVVCVVLLVWYRSRRLQNNPNQSFEEHDGELQRIQSVPGENEREIESNHMLAS